MLLEILKVLIRWKYANESLFLEPYLKNYFKKIMKSDILI